MTPSQPGAREEMEPLRLSEPEEDFSHLAEVIEETRRRIAKAFIVPRRLQLRHPLPTSTEPQREG